MPRWPLRIVDARELEQLSAKATRFRDIAAAMGFSEEGLRRRIRRETTLRTAFDRGRRHARKGRYGVGNRRELASRFWEKVHKTKKCWLWLGAKNNHGYGQIHFAGRTVLAHRVSYELNVGPIPPGKQLRHVVCDNPPCVRPGHLQPGSRRQNIADMVNKKRHFREYRGDLNPRTKLNPALVREIRKRYAAGGVSQKELASEYNVSGSLVCELLNGKIWQEV